MRRTATSHRRLTLETLETRQMFSVSLLGVEHSPHVVEQAALVAPAVKYPQLTGKSFVGVCRDSQGDVDPITVTYLTQNGAKLTGVLTLTDSDSGKTTSYNFVATIRASTHDLITLVGKPTSGTSGVTEVVVNGVINANATSSYGQYIVYGSHGVESVGIYQVSR